MRKNEPIISDGRQRKHRWLQKPYRIAACICGAYAYNKKIYLPRIDLNPALTAIVLQVPQHAAHKGEAMTTYKHAVISRILTVLIAAGTIFAVPAQEPAAVYMTRDISPQGMIAVYEALGATLEGSVAVKLSTGEAGNSYYLQPSLIADLVHKVNGTIVECNTAYGGSRASTALHRQVAEAHGFTAIADVDIMDADGEIRIPVSDGGHLSFNIVGKTFPDYDSVLVLSHFKGHPMAGFGGAIKNISIGFASASGKVNIHSAGTRTSGSIFHRDQDAFLESMAEAAKSVSDSKNGDLVYISVMNNLSIDCDCTSNPAEPDMHDIGILASLDPVALDKACLDLVYAAPDGESLISRIESRNGIHTVEHAEAIGLGTQVYRLVSLDE